MPTSQSRYCPGGPAGLAYVSEDTRPSSYLIDGAISVMLAFRKNGPIICEEYAPCEALHDRS